MDNYFNTIEELIGYFQESVGNEYTDFIPFIDDFGFSVKREYPSNIRYKPPKTKDGKHVIVALLRIQYVIDEEVESSRVPLNIDIGPYNIYKANHQSYHREYNFSDDDCPTKESLKLSESTPPPVGLKTKYFFDHSINTLVEKDGKAHSGKEVFDNIFQKHCDTIHSIKGKRLQIKKSFYKILRWILDIIIKSLEFILEKGFGRKIEPTDPFNSILAGYETKDIIEEKNESMDIFGYKTNRNIIFLFCVLIMGFYSTVYIFEISFLINIITNSYLAIIFSILILGFLDFILPVLIFKLINKLIKLRIKVWFPKFKF